MPKQMIADLDPNERVSSCFVVTERSLAPFKNKAGNYLSVTLSDRSGSIPGRAWDRAEQLAERFKVNEVVWVEGRVDEYRGTRQVIIEDLSPCEEGAFDRADFLPATKRDVEDLLAQLLEFMAQVRNPYLKTLLESFFGDEEILRAFGEAPGAKTLHHSHVGGLLEHTVAVVRILCVVQELHPELNRDLLVAAGLLHDIGKLWELSVGTAIEYTDIGRLVGHIVLTDREVRQRINEIPGFPPELDNQLNHILLSHHGQKEYGAPIVPMTAEACALHYADNLDAHVQHFNQVIEQGQTSGNRWTEYQKLFDRYLYIGSRGAEAAEEAEE
jgi:3'-5' exoribonuclease